MLSDFAEDVFKNAELAGKLSLAEIFQEAQARIDVVLDAPDFFLALLSYLKRFEIRPNTELYKMLGVKYHQIKSFSLSDIDALLNGLFFKERGLFGCAEAEISELKKSAEKAGLICKGKFSLLADGKIKRMCALSLGKLDAIEAIVSAQSAAFWRKFENADSCGLYKSGGAEFPDNELWGSSRIRDAQKARL